MGINLPCGNTPLTTTECGGDCDEKIERLAERVSEAEEKLDTIQEGAEVNVNADWEETDPDSDAYIENKPSVNYDLSLGDSAPTVGSAVVGSAVLGSLVDIILGRGDGTEDRVSVSGTGAIQITRDGDTMTIHVPVGEIDQLRNGTDTEARAWAANVLKQWLDERIAQIPADQFLDLNKTVFANPFTWSSTTYPGSINPNLDGKPVLVLALTDGENVSYSFLNMEDLIDAYEGVAPISVNGSQISHDNSGVTAGSYGDSSNQTPNFGDTFKALRSTVDAKGHVTSMSEHTVKIPDTLATQESAGLMSAEDKEKLDNVDQLYKTTCGNPITIDDADGEVKSLNVELTPIQDLHGYDKPWAAGAGKNKLDESTVTLSQATLNDGVYSATDGDARNILLYKLQQQTSGGAYISQVVSNTITQTGRISLTFTVDENAGKFRFTNAGQTQEFSFIFPNVFTAGTTVTFSIDIIDITIGASKFTKPQIEQGSTATSWVPYENICPITGRTQTEITDTGKNLLDPQYKSYSAQQNVRYYRNGGGGVKLYAGKTYTLSVADDNTTPAGIYMNMYGPNEASHPSVAYKYNAKSITYTPTEDVTIETDCYYASAPAEGIENIKVQLEINDTATAYEPYQGEAKTVTLPHTVYGADVDVTGGEGKEKMVIVDMGDLAWSKVNTSGSNYWFRASLPNTAIVPLGTVLPNIVCSQYGTVTPNDAYTGNTGVSQTAQAAYVVVCDMSYADATAFTQAVIGQKLCYELATPTDLQTTPTPLTLYKGDNVISSDGDMCITYLQDRGDLTDFINEMKDCCEEVKGSLLENLVDGSAQGSLRGIDTAQEDANYTLGTDATALGNGTKASGDYSVAEGTQTEASGLHSHAEGVQTKAMQQAAHAEGAATTANALFAHSEGNATNATGRNAHAEGGGTTASEESAHAEGGSTTASAHSAHAEGGGTVASARNAHAEGSGTKAVSMSQHVGGEFNELDPTGSATTRGTYVEIIGNGASDSSRSNARTLDWNGNEALQGGLTLGKGTADEVTITAAQLQQLLALI